MEPTYVLLLDKLKTMKVVSTGKLQDVFEKRIQFLMQIDLFKDFDMHVLLPLAFNLESCSYKLGEFILKEGQAPKGLYIITKGSIKIGSDQLCMRSKDIFPQKRTKGQTRPFKFKGNFHDMGDRIRIFDDDGHALERNLRMHDNRDSDGDDDGSPKLEKKRIYQDNRIF